MKTSKLHAALLCLTAASCLCLSSVASADPIIYNQPSDGGSNAYASQNDTNGGGNFATSFDNFTLTGVGRMSITDATWFGQYFNPPVQGNITGFTLSFYTDNGGIPNCNVGCGGTGPFATIHIAGNAGETSQGLGIDGLPQFSYSATFADVPVNAGQEYWLSIVPDLGFPPQWGWGTGVGPDGTAFQCFFGACAGIGNDLAFSLSGVPETPIPEPSSLLLLGTGLLGAVSAVRRKMSA